MQPPSVSVIAPSVDPLESLRREFPALCEMLEDRNFARHRAAFSVYLRLATKPEYFTEPQTLKIWALAEEIRMNREDVRHALNYLTRRGYVIDCGRGHRAVRRVMLARERIKSAA